MLNAINVYPETRENASGGKRETDGPEGRARGTRRSIARGGRVVRARWYERRARGVDIALARSVLLAVHETGDGDGGT